ncbi:MAG: Na+/H+ antiporter NhaA [Acidobacteriota bacterium]
MNLRQLMQSEAASGILLMLAAVLALIAANSSLAGLYGGLLDVPVSVSIGSLEIAKPLLLWINDGLMAIFFLLIGLEVKREVLIGQLSKPSQAIFPASAAVGGMLVPALFYVVLNRNDSDALAGWAVPTATDIAFALGVLALLGDRVPAALKIFLLALAILDDLGAIVIIAIFYAGDISLTSLALASVALVVLTILNRSGVTAISPYVVIGLMLWVFVLKSGVHATLAGVALAFAIPLRNSQGESPSSRLEHGLHSWVSFGIMPVFAFANAGVSLSGFDVARLAEPVTLGVILGLVIGKPLGVFGFSWLVVRTGLARLPQGVSWLQVYGVSTLCGIGFTMSLFIGSLAFEHLTRTDYLIANRIGILVGSLVSALVGYAVLAAAAGRRAPATAPVAAEP